MPRWSSSTSRPSTSCRSPTCSRRSPTTGIEFSDRGGFETDDEEYAKLVEAIIADEIGQGEGANLVIGRHYRAQVADWGARQGAHRASSGCCERERGAYWTFCFFTGDRYLSAPAPSGTSACTAATSG